MSIAISPSSALPFNHALSFQVRAHHDGRFIMHNIHLPVRERERGKHTQRKGIRTQAGDEFLRRKRESTRGGGEKGEEEDDDEKTERNEQEE